MCLHLTTSGRQSFIHLNTIKSSHLCKFMFIVWWQPLVTEQQSVQLEQERVKPTILISIMYLTYAMYIIELLFN